MMQMITLKELKAKTGYNSFLKFKRQCIRSSDSVRTADLTKYLYDSTKVVELAMKPEELFMAADGEIAKLKKTKSGRNKRRATV
jgi:hypothetical protein